MININFFSNTRLEIFELIFHFINKIKDENKTKIKITILTTHVNTHFFKDIETKYPSLKIDVIEFKDGLHYTDKLKYAINSDAEFSIKLDEDCIINNFIWDYMIENVNVLNNSENLLISPLLSTTLPACDEFISGFLNEEEADVINSCFLNQRMPNGLFGVNYEPLNEFTTKATTWKP